MSRAPRARRMLAAAVLLGSLCVAPTIAAHDPVPPVAVMPDYSLAQHQTQTASQLHAYWRGLGVTMLVKQEGSIFAHSPPSLGEGAQHPIATDTDFKEIGRPILPGDHIGIIIPSLPPMDYTPIWKIAMSASIAGAVIGAVLAAILTYTLAARALAQKAQPPR